MIARPVRWESESRPVPWACGHSRRASRVRQPAPGQTRQRTNGANTKTTPRALGARGSLPAPHPAPRTCWCRRYQPQEAAPRDDQDRSHDDRPFPPEGRPRAFADHHPGEAHQRRDEADNPTLGQDDPPLARSRTKSPPPSRPGSSRPERTPADQPRVGSVGRRCMADLTAGLGPLGDLARMCPDRPNILTPTDATSNGRHISVGPQKFRQPAAHRPAPPAA